MAERTGKLLSLRHMLKDKIEVNVQGRSTGEKQSFRLGVRMSLLWRKCGQLGLRNVQEFTERRAPVQRPSKTAVGLWDSQSWVPRIQDE